MRTIAQYLGGSHSYGLDTPTSDKDIRAIFLNTEPKYIIGLDKHEHEIINNIHEDSKFTEYRRALQLLSKGNTEMVEALYNTSWLFISKEWDDAIACRRRLVSSEKLFTCLRGYKQSEINLAFGLRKGVIGGKRYKQVESFGYSPKNVVQCLRLMWAGRFYFERGHFPVNVFQWDESFGRQLMDIKTKPEGYSIEWIKDAINELEINMVAAFEKRTVNTIFDSELANDLICSAYGYKV